MKKILLTFLFLTSLTFGQSRLLDLFDDGLPQPFSGDALFILDGTIVDVGGTKYFNDGTANNRDFLITGYDFDATWSKGFPYKTAATISAPAGDSVLIAEDINHYLYAAADSTPNQIPVVSLFQDVDYEHKLFTRHAAQVLDGNLVETYEPRVMDIVLYNTVKSGSELTTCQTYYGVPTEAVTHVRWIDPVNGSDGAAGSKAAPWLTLPKSTTSATAGDTIYIKTGLCNISTGIWNSSTKALYHKCIGYNRTLTTVSRATMIYPHTGTFDGFNIDGTSVTGATFLSLGSVSVNLVRVKITGGAYPINNNATGIANNMTDCVFTSYTSYAILNYGNVNANTCLMSSADKPIVSNKQVSAVITVLNSKFVASSLTTPTAGFSTVIIGNWTMKGCTATLSSYALSVYDCGDVAINYNNISIAVTLYRSTTPTISLSNVEIIGNTINSTSVTGIISITNKNLVCTGNVLNHTAASGTIISHLPFNVSLTTNISGNTLNTLGDGSPIIIGDATFVIKDKITGSITNNKILGNLYYGGGVATHGVSIWANAGVSIENNYINGWDIAIVLKGGNSDYATNTIAYNKIINGYLTTRGISNVPIYNNTFIQNSTSKLCIDLLTDELGNESLNAQIKNNIFVNNSTNGAGMLMEIEDGSTPVIDYNIYYSNDDSIGWLEAGSHYVGFAGWQAAGYDTNGIVITTAGGLDSLFTNTSTFDISLPTGSAAIDAGIDLGADYDMGFDPTTNWAEDTEIPSVVLKQQTGDWDIGAYIK